MPPLLVKLVLGRVPVLGKTAQRRFQSMIDVHLDYVEAELASRPWFAGDAMTAADIMMSFPLEAARHRAGLDARRPASPATRVERSEEHTSELQSLMRSSYAVFCLKKKNTTQQSYNTTKRAHYT